MRYSLILSRYDEMMQNQVTSHLNKQRKKRSFEEIYKLGRQEMTIQNGRLPNRGPSTSSLADEMPRSVDGNSRSTPRSTAPTICTSRIIIKRQRYHDSLIHKTGSSTQQGTHRRKRPWEREMQYALQDGRGQTELKAGMASDWSRNRRAERLQQACIISRWPDNGEAPAAERRR